MKKEIANSEIKKTDRGFEYIEIDGVDNLRVQQSSAAIYTSPGTSFLWIGDAHLNEAQIRTLIEHLIKWEDSGNL